jgi:hypothetical protein
MEGLGFLERAQLGLTDELIELGHFNQRSFSTFEAFSKVNSVFLGSVH